MKKSEMFDILVDKVAEMCDIRRELMINHAKLQAAVEGRVLAVQYLRRLGLSCKDIALFVSREVAGDKNCVPPAGEIESRARGINKMFNSYSQRCLDSRAFRSISKDLCAFCKETFKDLYDDE